jgi:hypothetical protein
MRMASKATPLEGVRVLNLGGGWAGRVAAMLLADQGADVMEIERPGRESQLEDALLGRGKALASLNLKDIDGQERAPISSSTISAPDERPSSAWTIPVSASATLRWFMCPFPALRMAVR